MKLQVLRLGTGLDIENCDHGFEIMVSVSISVSRFRFQMQVCQSVADLDVVSCILVVNLKLLLAK